MIGKGQDHLYVMQATDGRVKIGRSIHPEKRLKQLQMIGGMKLTLIGTVHLGGDREGELLGELWEHATIGEWVKNCPEMWDALNAFLGTNLVPVVKPKPPALRKRYARTERRILADGSIKIYSYPAPSSAQ